MFQIISFNLINVCHSLPDFTEEAEFTLSRAGQFKLTHQNHGFYKHSVKPNGETFWRCDKYRIRNCKVKAFTFKVGSKEMVKVFGSHMHEQTLG